MRGDDCLFGSTLRTYCAEELVEFRVRQMILGLFHQHDVGFLSLVVRQRKVGLDNSLFAFPDEMKWDVVKVCG